MGIPAKSQLIAIFLYFQNDKIRLPSLVEEVIAEGEKHLTWMKALYPDMLSCVVTIQTWISGGKFGRNLALLVVVSFLTQILFSWPQAADELLEDMYLPIMRNGGSWLNRVLKVIDLKEITTLGEERRAMREKNQSLQVCEHFLLSFLVH